MRRDPALIPLSRDHHHALALCVVTRRELNDSNVAAQAARIVREFDAEIARHFAKEEQVLFPDLQTLMGDLVAELLSEHERIRALVEGLRAAPERAVIEDFIAILPQHVRKEESRLFEDAQRLLSRDQLDQLGARLTQMENGEPKLPVCRVNLN